jgi:hypothetical protein
MRALLLCLSALLLATCGGSSSSNTTVTCSSLSPTDCGGDISGSWALQSTCETASVPIPDLPAACAGATLSATPTTPSGSAKFTSGTYDANVTLSFTTKYQLSSACISAVAPGADLATSCNDLAQSSSMNGLSFTCTPLNGGCDCAGTLNETVTENGTYTTSGNQVTLTPTSSSGGGTAPSTNPYCVRSGQLIMKFPSPFVGGPDMFLIFKKQ